MDRLARHVGRGGAGSRCAGGRRGGRGRRFAYFCAAGLGPSAQDRGGTCAGPLRRGRGAALAARRDRSGASDRGAGGEGRAARCRARRADRADRGGAVPDLASRARSFAHPRQSRLCGRGRGRGCGRCRARPGRADRRSRRTQPARRRGGGARRRRDRPAHPAGDDRWRASRDAGRRDAARGGRRGRLRDRRRGGGGARAPRSPASPMPSATCSTGSPLASPSSAATAA